MWFKNLTIYRFTKSFTLTNDQLELELEKSPFKPCGSHDSYQLGWASPLGKHSQQKVHVTDRFWMVCLQKQERILPSSVVNEQLQERINEIEEQQHRKVSRKERTELKDQLTTELLPKSFTKTNRFFAYLAPKEGYLVINTSSNKVADEFTSYLRKTIGSLPVRPISVNQSPSATMSHWVTEPTSIPSQFDIADECELSSTGEEKASIKYKGLELDSEQINQQISEGFQVSKLAACWNNSLSFIIGEDLSIKRLKFGELMQEKLDDIDAEDPASQFDAGFALMALELDNFIPDILEVFGGEDKSAILEAA